MTSLRSLGLSALALASLDCTLMYADDIDEKQCQRDADCASRGEGFTCKLPEGVCRGDGAGTGEPVACTQNRDCPEAELCGFDKFCYQPWGCLADDPDWPEASSNFTYSAPLVSIKNPENPALLGDDIEVLACSSGDPDCASPIARGEVDAANNATVRFQNFRGAQFNGFLRIRDASGVDGTDDVAFLPGYVHYGSETRLVSDLHVQSRIFLVDPATYRELAQLSGTGADPNAGTVVFIMHDCGGRTVAGVSIEALGAPNALFVAVQGGNQPVPGSSATTQDGAGLLLNVPPDQARTFVFRDDASSRELGRISINVRGRATNYVYYYPRYAALKQWLDEYERSTE